MTTQKAVNTPLQADRRKYQRRVYQGTLEIEWGSSVLTGTLRDIGPRGLFVNMDSPLWIGAAFSARLLLEPILTLRCMVRRVEPGVGIGVVFEELTGSGKLQLDKLLDTLPHL
jgi:hypothetical protein